MRRLAALCLALVAISLPMALGATEASAKSSRFLFGIIPQQTLDAHDFESMHTAGARSLRIALYWSQVEPWPGARDWSHSDAVVAEAARNGVSVLPYLYGSPAWSATADRYACTSDCAIYAPSSDASRARFAAFAADAVRRYGRDGSFWEANPALPYRPIRTWQVWNEQNTSKYFAPAPDAERYAALLIAAADAIRSVDRKTDVALGGMWGPKGAHAVVPVVSYLKLLYPIPGVRRSIDSLTVHPYGKNADQVVEQVREVHRVATRFHDRKATILATELGWASTGPADHWLVKGRRGQARVLRNSYKALLKREQRWRIRGVWWYAWQDNPPEAGFICLWCPGAGLVGLDGRRKPAWRAMKKLATRERRKQPRPPSYGRFFWEEYNRPKSFARAWLDASWRISHAQEPSVVAVGASGEEALARLENERLFEWSHVSRDWYQWWWYDRAAEPLAQRSLECPSEPLVAELRPPVPALEQVREVATRHGVELPDPSGPTAGLLVSRAGDRSLSVLADGRYELSLAVPNAANAAALSIDDARRRASELIGEHGLDRDVDLEFDSVRRTMSAGGPPGGRPAR